MQQIASIFYSIMFLKKDQIEPEHAQVYTEWNDLFRLTI